MDVFSEYENLYERLEKSNRTPVFFRTQNWVIEDVHRGGAAQMYRENNDGCRTLWKSLYRQRKLHRRKNKLWNQKPNN
jgi:hypothetical protein